jgi:predicted HTH domain antitoxin
MCGLTPWAAEVYVADLYREGRISLRDAARRTGKSSSETLDALQRMGIAGNVTADDALQSLKSFERKRTSHNARVV